ncbi:MAG: hypothetical protein PHP44_03555 [Kiritimatiellae bacterium]|nr:hypothetical protein [Kiritimatiellia bacterium]MDD4735166.1 hypothetical protein [Kiritimatiellia bacterium]
MNKLIRTGLIPFIAAFLLIPGCAAPPNNPQDGQDQWGHDVRSRQTEIGPGPGRRIKLTDEVDIMRDVDERQKW